MLYVIFMRVGGKKCPEMYVWYCQETQHYMWM